MDDVASSVAYEVLGQRAQDVNRLEGEGAFEATGELLVDSGCVRVGSEGRSTELFEECFQRRWYRTAACYILVIAKLEGPAVSQYCALSLLQATLDEALYELAGELVRFLLRSGREYDNSNTDSDKLSPRFLGYFLFRSSNKRQSFDSKSASFKEQSAHVTSVKNILESHASYLMTGKELFKLVAFVKGTQFDLVEYLHREKSGSARLESFASGLEIIGQKQQYQMHLAEMKAAKQGMPVVSVNHDNSAEGPTVKDIHMENFSVSIGGRELIVDGVVTLSFGRHYGLVGRNRGKTYFLRHMAMHAMDGIPKNCQILHVEQEVVGDTISALQCVLNSDVERTQLLQDEANLLALQRDEFDESEENNGKVNREMKDRISKRRGYIYKGLEFIDADSAKSHAASILAGLSFTPKMQRMATKTFSGGWRGKQISRALSTKAHTQGNSPWKLYAWRRNVLDRTGPVQLPIVTADGQLIDIEHGKYYATGGYMEQGRVLKEWFRSYRCIHHGVADDLSACSNFSELMSIQDGAVGAESFGLTRYWLRSDSQVGISYLRRAFCRYLRTNNLEASVQFFKPKFRLPVRSVIGLYIASGSFPKLVKLPSSENKLADYLARNAPWSFSGMLSDCTRYSTSLPTSKARSLWFRML